MSIARRYEQLRRRVPDHVTIVLAVKNRTPDEVREALEAGATDLGENYVREAEAMIGALGPAAVRVRWHMIGRLQKNKINKSLGLFDVFQTLHAVDQAEALSRRASGMGKRVPTLIEINSAAEEAKTGLAPEIETVLSMAEAVSRMEGLILSGLMTMGPFLEDPQAIRPYFRKTREIFEAVAKAGLPGADFRHLSMGMSDSYPVAIEEGATMIRVGTSVFGPRPIQAA